MNRSYAALSILFFFFSEVAISCDNEQGKYLQLSLDSSQYLTKPDTSKPLKPSLFSKKGKHPSLFCSTSSGSKCGEDSVWFSSEEFAKYLVSYKPVHCYQEVNTLKVQSGVKKRKTSFVVYYSVK